MYWASSKAWIVTRTPKIVKFLDTDSVTGRRLAVKATRLSMRSATAPICNVSVAHVSVQNLVITKFERNKLFGVGMNQCGLWLLEAAQSNKAIRLAGVVFEL